MVPLAITVALCAPAFAAQPAAIDDNDRVVLRGNVHPLARPESSVGRAPLDMPMERMILVLKRRPGAEAELDRLLAAQQDPASPEYHHWLTPEEFGLRFGLSDDQIGRVTEWLESEGFTVEEVARGRGWIDFSGDVATVERVFRTEIRDYLVNGEIRHANATDPSFPRAIASLVHGISTLHSFPKHPMNTGIRAADATGPDYTSGSSHYLSPGDFAVIYDVNALYSAGITGSGQTVAIVGRTHPSATNWSTFRSTMNLPANAPQVVLNGTDPGDLGSGEDGEADLDVEWSGAVAKNATVKFVVSKSTSTTDGVDLSAQYIVNNNLAPVMSTSFGQCESSMGSSENSFYNSLWSQAASQGITSFVSSGDSGASGCDGGSSSTGSGQAVSGLSSTPYNVAVGGTQFNEGSGSYWSSSNSTGDVSALSYIPETAWNESGNVSGGSGLWATGGGVSTVYAKPSWQSGTGVPADGKRDVPDVSLTAASHDGYLVETGGSLQAIGGTSASSPSFAGLMTLIVQKTGARQGNANTRFYQLAAVAGVFHDTTSGNNSVPGVTGFSCTTGYDRATGLGSVDANALANNWAGTASTYAISGNAGTTGATVSTGSASATSDSSSNYTIAGLVNGTYTVTPSKSGCTFTPASQSVTVNGANVTAVNFTASCTAPTYSISGNAGTSGATVTTGSASATSDASSNYTIAGLANATYTVTPSKSGCTFSPASQSVTVNGASVSGVNFTASCGSTGGGLTNGTFETGSLSPWTATGVSSVISSGAHGGTYAAQLGSTSPSTDSTLAQTFTLPSNASSLSFYVKITCPDTLTYDWATATLKDNATGTTTTLLAKTCSNTGAWQNVSASVSASAGHSVTLTLANHDDNYSGDATYSAWDDVTVATSTPTPAFTLAASPTSVTAAQGASTKSTLTTAVSGGFSSAISFSASGIPSGATASFSPTSIAAPGSGSSTLTLAAGTAAAGTYTVTVTATGGGITHTAAISFTVTASGGTAQQLLGNPGFENGSTSTAPWTTTSGVVDNSASEAAHSGSWKAWLDGYGTTHTDSILQTVSIPSTATSAALSFWLHIDTAETTTTTQYDKLQVQIRNSSGTVLATLATYSNLNAASGYTQKSFNVLAYKGQTVQVYLVGTEDSSAQTSFVLDDFALNVQ